MNKIFLLKLVSNAVLFSIGIMMILFSSIQYGQWWSFMTVFVTVIGIAAPFLLGGCAFDDYTQSSSGPFSWLILGFFVILGYAIPVEMFRAKSINQVGIYLTLGGVTIILASLIIFFRLLYFEKNSFNAYML